MGAPSPGRARPPCGAGPPAEMALESDRSKSGPTTTPPCKPHGQRDQTKCLAGQHSTRASRDARSATAQGERRGALQRGGPCARRDAPSATIVGKHCSVSGGAPLDEGRAAEPRGRGPRHAVARGSFLFCAVERKMVPGPRDAKMHGEERPRATGRRPRSDKQLSPSNARVANLGGRSPLCK